MQFPSNVGAFLLAFHIVGFERYLLWAELHPGTEISSSLLPKRFGKGDSREAKQKAHWKGLPKSRRLSWVNRSSFCSRLQVTASIHGYASAVSSMLYLQLVWNCLLWFFKVKSYFLFFYCKYVKKIRQLPIISYLWLCQRKERQAMNIILAIIAIQMDWTKYSREEFGWHIS